MNALAPTKLRNPDLARKIINRPHILGNYLGYRELDDLHSEWIKKMWRTSGHKSLQAHRGSYKTTSVIVVGNIDNMLWHWNDRTAIIRKDFTSASEVLKVVGRLIMGERFQALTKEIFGVSPRLTTFSTSKLQWDWKTRETPEGNLNAFGIGGSITGKHFDHIQLDDIITIRDRISKAERDTVDNFVREILANVIDPGRWVQATGTPWHKMDTWRLLPPPVLYDIYTTGIKAFTPERVAEIKHQTTASLFAANYELKHIASDETIFPEPKFTDQWDMTVPIYGHIDAKYQGGHTGAFTMMGRRPDGKIQAIGFIFHKHIEEEYGRLVSKWREYRGGTVSLELNADKGYASRDLHNLGMMTRNYHESENKHVKIVQNLKKHYDMIEWHKNTDMEYIAQIMDYQEGQEPDDCADSASSCLRESGVYREASVDYKAEEYRDGYEE